MPGPAAFDDGGIGVGYMVVAAGVFLPLLEAIGAWIHRGRLAHEASLPPRPGAEANGRPALSRTTGGEANVRRWPERARVPYVRHPTDPPLAGG